jgi:hypothetical protein
MAIAGLTGETRSMRTTSLFKDYALLAGSGLFDVEYYRRGDPGLAAHVDPLMHYLEYGALERRDPGPDFVTVYYLEQCRALGETPGNPLLHYLTVGAARGLEPTPRAVASQDIQLAIDVPNLAEGTARVAAGATNFVVSGWALATEGIAGIQVVVDNAFAASAYYGIKRADVATAFPDNPDSLLAGFEAVIRCDGLDEGPHTVTVTARGKGEAVSRSVFVLDVPARPQGPPPNPIRARSSAAETWLCHRVLKGLDWSPRFLLILPITRGDDTLENARRTIASLEAQVYRDWHLVILRGPGSSTGPVVRAKLVDGFDAVSERTTVCSAAPDRLLSQLDDV